MGDTRSLSELLAAFPTHGSHRVLLEWLLELFILWDQAANKEVNEKRRAIASLVGRTCKIAPDPELPHGIPNSRPGNAKAAEWLLTFAINLLVVDDLGQAELGCWYFVFSARQWLGLSPQP